MVTMDTIYVIRVSFYREIYAWIWFGMLSKFLVWSTKRKFMESIIIDKNFETLKNYITNVNNFANVDYIDKYLEYISRIKTINNYGK